MVSNLIVLLAGALVVGGLLQARPPPQVAPGGRLAAVQLVDVKPALGRL